MARRKQEKYDELDIIMAFVFYLVGGVFTFLLFAALISAIF